MRGRGRRRAGAVGAALAGGAALLGLAATQWTARSAAAFFRLRGRAAPEAEPEPQQPPPPEPAEPAPRWWGGRGLPLALAAVIFIGVLPARSALRRRRRRKELAAAAATAAAAAAAAAAARAAEEAAAKAAAEAAEAQARQAALEAATPAKPLVDHIGPRCSPPRRRASIQSPSSTQAPTPPIAGFSFVLQAETPGSPSEVAVLESTSCPGCGKTMPELRRHMKKCCPQLLPERTTAGDADAEAAERRRRRVAEARETRRKAASEESWITEEEVREAARRSVEEMADPLLRQVLHLRFGLDRGEPRTPAEVAEALGGKYQGRPEAAFTLIREAQKSIPLVADDPKDLCVIYEDDHLLAVSKPPGLRTVPVHRFIGKSLTNQVLGYIQQSARQRGEENVPRDAPMLLHRLDQTTSGVVLFAKTKAAASYVQRHWHGPKCRKEYIALASQSPNRRQPSAHTGGGACVWIAEPGEAALVRAPIGRDVESDDPVRRAVNFEDGQSAATHFETLAAGDWPANSHKPPALLHTRADSCAGRRVALLLCALEENGRTHQIRVHAAHIGMPLLGDDMYGGLSTPEGEEGTDRVALHAWRLRAPHPATGNEVVIEAPFPEDIRRSMKSCGMVWSSPPSAPASPEKSAARASPEQSTASPEQSVALAD